jgi:hypothetical protein
MPALFPEELLIGREWRAAPIGGRFAMLKPGDRRGHHVGGRRRRPRRREPPPCTGRPIRGAASREITESGAPSATIERCQIAGSACGSPSQLRHSATASARSGRCGSEPAFWRGSRKRSHRGSAVLARQVSVSELSRGVVGSGMIGSCE